MNTICPSRRCTLSPASHRKIGVRLEPMASIAGIGLDAVSLELAALNAGGDRNTYNQMLEQTIEAAAN